MKQTDKSQHRHLNLKSYGLRSLLMVALVLLLCACGGRSAPPESGAARTNNGLLDEEVSTVEGTGVSPQAGHWATDRVAFEVSADGSLVERFEVSYSGRATNAHCEFDYSDVVSVNDLQIEDGVFLYDSEELGVMGLFNAPGEAEVTVLWFGYYGGACQVDYNGELTEVVTVAALAQ